jgi:hypothetical protein
MATRNSFNGVKVIVLTSVSSQEYLGKAGLARNSASDENL